MMNKIKQEKAQMVQRIFIFLLVFCAAVSFAGDLTTKSGKIYKNYAIMGAAPNGIRVFHDGGVVVLPVSEFPPELKEVVEKIAKDIPAAKKAAAEKAKEQQAQAAEKKKQAQAEAARQKKSAALLAEEEKAEQEKQAKLIKATPAASGGATGGSGSKSLGISLKK